MRYDPVHEATNTSPEDSFHTNPYSNNHADSDILMDSSHISDESSPQNERLSSPNDSRYMAPIPPQGPFAPPPSVDTPITAQSTMSLVTNSIAQPVYNTPSPSSASNLRPSLRKRKSMSTPASSSSKHGHASKKHASSKDKKTQNRTYQTLLFNSRIRHLKKKDGEPLWRKDIQYDLLSLLFNNDSAVFTDYSNPTGSKKTFSEIYIESMARSSKCSKVLREKLLGDKKFGINIAMVCILVNIGRMNTTLNFFPEMRSQLRTYHPIPALQGQSDQNDYKQLQDAPRLKSILKGACDDRPEPSTINEMISNSFKPHTNPINLIFLLSTYSEEVKNQFFLNDEEFYDILMTSEYSSISRSNVFLWLLWSYLETDLSPESLRKNPFGFGRGDGLKTPPFIRLTDEEMLKENIDTQDEKDFGSAMALERKNYLEAASILSPTPTNQPSSSLNPNNHASNSNSSSSSASNNNNGTVPLNLSNADDNSRSPSPIKIAKKKITKSEQNARKTAILREKKCRDVIDLLLKKRLAIGKIHRQRIGSIRKNWKKIKNLNPLDDSDEELFLEWNNDGRNVDESSYLDRIISKNLSQRVFGISTESLIDKLHTGHRKLGGGKKDLNNHNDNDKDENKAELNSNLENYKGDYGEEDRSLLNAFRKVSNILNDS